MAIPYLYTDYGEFLRREFPFKVQKISINAGFTCPNRNGEKGWGGCTYCNNQTFNPAYCRTEKTITEQLEEGKRFFGRKYPDMKFLAYFQAYTNTYGEVDEVIRKYEEALVVLDVVGIVIGTRPDCMPQALLDYLTGLNRRTFLMVEYGIESVACPHQSRAYVCRDGGNRPAYGGCRHTDWWAYHPRAARREA